MQSEHSASIIISTRNRAGALAETVQALSQTSITKGTTIELIIVDNGSTDSTPAVLGKCAAILGSTMRFVALAEPVAGKARALNQAVAVATGNILIFIDDDVRVPQEWIAPLTEPIRDDGFDAVAGGIRLAPHLIRPWMTDEHYDYLACTSHKNDRPEHPTVGANCAIRRKVVHQLGAFDPEVGPGAIGHAEDLFFWLKMRAAGCKLGVRFDVEVEHHPSDDRLTATAFRQMARKNGDWEAYVDYHWTQTPRRTPRLSLLYATMKLWAARLRHLRDWLTHPAVPAWELPLLAQVRFRSRYLVERRQPRKYEREGFVKLYGPSAA